MSDGRDQVDRAIESAEMDTPAAYQQVQITIKRTGRAMYVGVPVDVTEREVLEMLGWCGAHLLDHVAASQRPTLEVARRLPPGLGH